MNIYEGLLSDLVNNKEAVIVTRLMGREGLVDKDISRYLTYDNHENIQVDSRVNIQLNPQANIQGNPHGDEEGESYDVRKIDWKDNGEIHIREPFYPKERLIILGGGHIALPLAEFAAKTGFEVIIGDDRPSFANKQRFPLAEDVLCDSFENIISNIKVTRNDYIVIITRGHRHDMECLRQLLRLGESKYLGMIGSKRRVRAVLDILRDEGYDQERLNRICTPIGLPIDAVTPEEISISILAELILRKRSGSKNKKTLSQGDIDFYVLELLAKAKEPMCLVTVIDTKGSTPRGIGAKMLVYPTGQVRGSIGGGCSEAVVLHKAVSMIGSGRYEVQTIDMTGDVAESEGMVCGGLMEVLIEDLTSTGKNI
ncbi:MAG: hypothetical protein K0S61_2064 [Anaerocolumna sp.]|nr:hypothetical protein [Anaerocolumna sp.]